MISSFGASLNLLHPTGPFLKNVAKHDLNSQNCILDSDQGPRFCVLNHLEKKFLEASGKVNTHQCIR